MPRYDEETEVGLQAWRDALSDLLEVLAGTSSRSMEDLRTGYTAMLRKHAVPAGIQVEETLLGTVPARRVIPHNAVKGRTLVYFHGGAYLFGSAEGYVALAGRLGLALRSAVVVPDYRLAPEHPYPVPILDCVDAYEALLATGLDPTKTFFAGDSAGGALTLSVMTHARERGLPLPAGGLAISPWVELTHAGESMRTRDGIDPLCTREALDLQARSFLGGERATVPDVSLVRADLRGLPPILIQIGEAEVMLSGALELAAALADQRVEVTLEVVPDMFHVWHLFAASLPQAREAIDRAATFGARLWDSPTPTRSALRTDPTTDRDAPRSRPGS